MSLTLEAERRSSDGTQKYLWQLLDRRRIETVYFELDDFGAGLCVSSQAGCNVGCTFCATGLQRPARNLRVEEIVGQVTGVFSERDPAETGRHCKFVVFAGMGEPLHNYRAVVDAARAMRDDLDIALVSLSTSGVVPRIYDLADDAPFVQLHVSLHATDDDLRSSLIPLNRRWNISQILGAGAHYADRTGRKTIINHLLLRDVNDSDRDAERLASLLDAERFEVYVLPWNELDGFAFRRVTDEHVAHFASELQNRGISATPQFSKGRDIEAGCGQLLPDDVSA